MKPKKIIIDIDAALKVYRGFWGCAEIRISVNRKGEIISREMEFFKSLPRKKK